jgi:dTDP-4-amino-4,6-dideoxygalactose transaminase
MKQINVTSPLLPELKQYEEYLEDIWNKKWITNNGEYHQKLEAALAQYLGVKYISLFTNGTLPLITALQALDLREGEVITTPYSFVATTHSIWWNGLKPIFVDVDPITGNIDPNKIEAAITTKTVAIMPVHVYGNPCDTDAIQKIADKYHLKVIYDAAHAFGVTVNNKSILEAGDISTLSFHATKVFNTVEGGALICHSAEMKKKIDHLKNFGFVDEVTVDEPGINSKMDELRAAFGLLNLKQIDKAINRRKEISEQYREGLKDIKGIRYINDLNGVKHNYSYFPIFIDENEYGMSRDALYETLKKYNIFTRRYFYPLISDFPMYKSLESAKQENLPVAVNLANTVLCLPMYADLETNDVQEIINILRK